MENLENSASDQTFQALKCVKYFADAIPHDLKLDLQTVFAPTSIFWEGTNYTDRGYYSFWYDLKKTPSNTIEILIRHLLPIVEQSVPGETFCGAEWWVHSRPEGRNLGHQLHLDTEENTLEIKHKIVHPRVSSVVYLSPNSNGGCTIVFDQSLEDACGKKVPEKSVGAYVCRPSEGGFLIFDGKKIHGVLPSNPLNDVVKNSDSDGPSGRHASAKRRRCQASFLKKNEQKHRLTLMVGFWTEDVQKNGKRTLLGPCGPTPSTSTRRNNWPSVLKSSYFVKHDGGKIDVDATRESISTKEVPVKRIFPAWENISQHHHGNARENTIEIPEEVDQRFFLHDMEEFKVHLLERALNKDD